MTRDVLDELAEWYAPPASPPGAGHGPSAPRYVAPREVSLWSAARRAFLWILETLLAWHDRARERRSLMELSDQVLRDIGLSRTQLRAQAARPSWRI